MRTTMPVAAQHAPWPSLPPHTTTGTAHSHNPHTPITACHQPAHGHSSLPSVQVTKQPTDVLGVQVCVVLFGRIHTHKSGTDISKKEHQKEHWKQHKLKCSLLKRWKEDELYLANPMNKLILPGRCLISELTYSSNCSEQAPYSNMLEGLASTSWKTLTCLG